MNKLEETLQRILEKSIELAEQTGEFVMDQAPLLLQEFYRWHIFENIFIIFVGIIVYLLGRYLPYFWLNEYTEDDDIKFFKKSGDDGGISAYIFYIICSLAFIIMFFIALYDLIFILTAPKIYLIEYFI